MSPNSFSVLFLDVCCFWTIKVTGNARNVSNTRASVMNTRANTTAKCITKETQQNDNLYFRKQFQCFSRQENNIFAHLLFCIHGYRWPCRWPCLYRSHLVIVCITHDLDFKIDSNWPTFRSTKICFVRKCISRKKKALGNTKNTGYCFLLKRKFRYDWKSQ